MALRSYYGGGKKLGKMAENYGVANTRGPGGRPGSHGAQQNPYRSQRQVEGEIAAKMANDYSTREFLKHNDDIRDQLKRGLPSNSKEVELVYDAMKKQHKEDGNGGKFSNRNDRQGVAQSSFENYEKEQRSYVDEQLNQMGKRNTQEDSVGDTTKPYVKSEALARAQANVERHQSPQAEESSAESQNRDKAQSFLDLYRTDFINGSS